MTKLTDGKRTVAIEMMIWQKTGYSPDWSNDFFEVGGLPCHEDEQTGDTVYHVGDVDYCIEQAQEWPDEDDDNTVFVEDVKNG